MFTKPNMFNNYIIGSPSVWFKDNDILKIKTEPNFNKHKVFIAVGANETIELDSPNHDMVKGAKELKLKISGDLFPNKKVKILTIQGANHELHFQQRQFRGYIGCLKVNGNCINRPLKWKNSWPCSYLADFSQHFFVS